MKVFQHISKKKIEKNIKRYKEKKEEHANDPKLAKYYENMENIYQEIEQEKKGKDE